MDWITEPFGVAFVQRALAGGILVAAVCAIVGTWVVVRGMAFLGEAMGHGMLPGIAIAALAGGNPILGAAASAAAMAGGVSAISRSRRLSQDTAIGLLFVGMLALGVVIVSRSGSFAVDLTDILFGDVLAVRPVDLAVLTAVLAGVLVTAVLCHRPLMALAFDRRKAASLGLRPGAAHLLLLVLVAAAVASSFQVVGTLLVFGLLIAPPAAALVWARSVRSAMAGAAVTGGVSVAAGLLVSWHASTAAGATIALTAVVLFFASAALKALLPAGRVRSPGTVPLRQASASSLTSPAVPYPETGA